MDIPDELPDVPPALHPFLAEDKTPESKGGPFRLPSGNVLGGEGGCEYSYDEEGLADVIHIDHLGFCGCGRQEESLEYLRNTLRILNTGVDGFPGDDWGEKYAAWKKAQDELHGSDGAAFFMWYWLDKEGYTEHGGSVPGWTTSKGDELLAALEEVTKEPEHV